MARASPDFRRLDFLDIVRHDLRIALRLFRRNAVFTTVALVSLAIGIGANSAVFSIVNAVMLKPFPYPHAERLVAIWEKRPDGHRSAMSTLNYLDYAGRSIALESIAATTGCCAYVMLGEGEAPTRLTSLHVSATYFDVLGATPALGRTFVSGEDTEGRDHVVVLSHKLWASRFGADPTLIGRSIRLDGQPYTVVGVMPAGGAFDRTHTEIWLPLAVGPDRMNRGSHWLLTITGAALGRLKPGVTVAQARAEMEAIGARLSAEYPSSNRGWSVVVEPYASVVVGQDLAQSLSLLFAAVGMVLLIGCVNLANVMLARALARDREIAVRAALGATRARLVQQFLTESLLLSIGGGLLGLVVAYGIIMLVNAGLARLPLTMATFPILIPAEASIGIDGRVLLFTWMLCMAAGVGFGLAPAFGAARATNAALASGGGRASTAVVHRRLRSALVVAEVALAYVLLVDAGLLIRSFFRMRGAETGFEAANVVTAEISLRDHRFATPTQLHAFVRQVIDAIEVLPGVSGVAVTDSMPLQGTPTLAFFQVAGQPRVERSQRPTASFKVVSSGYLRALGLRLQRGRWLSDRDREETSRVAVINDTMARMFFSNDDAVGQHLVMNQPGLGFVLPGPDVPWEVIGVIADERLTPFDDKTPHPAIYVSNEQSPTPFAGIVVRTALDASHLEKVLKQAIAAVDRDQPVSDVKTLAQLKDESMTPDRLRSSLLSVFAAMTLILSGAGIYGVVSYLVGQRTQELGIRAALGASRESLLALAIGPGMIQAALGLALGCVGAFGTTRLLGSFLFGVGPSDAVTFVTAAGLLAAAAFIGCYLPARRAARVDPLTALHAE